MDQKKQIMTVELAVTRQPAPYESVRCRVEAPVLVGPEDDVAKACQLTLRRLRREVEAQIDEEFESRDLAPPYFWGQRWMFCYVPKERLGAILPQMATELLPHGWREAHNQEAHQGHRHDRLMEMVERDFPEYEVIDCRTAAGEIDLSLLPEIEFVRVWPLRRVKAVVIEPGTAGVSEVRSVIFDRFDRFWSGPHTFVLLSVNVIDHLDKHYEEYEVIDCRDGDWSRLPEPPPAPEVEENDVPFE